EGLCNTIQYGCRVFPNRGSAIAKIVGVNAAALDKFDKTVRMWVFEEMVNGRKLTEIINTDHENVKYLPGHKLPPNVVAVPDVVDAAKDADILVFVIPHQFIGRLCDTLKDSVKKDAIGISLIKGVDEGPEGLKLISAIIREKLGIAMSVLMGANIANEVAEEKFCETTIGCKVKEHGALLKELMQTPNFRITVVQEADVVEICGALKVGQHLPSPLCSQCDCTIVVYLSKPGSLLSTSPQFLSIPLPSPHLSVQNVIAVSLSPPPLCSECDCSVSLPHLLSVQNVIAVSLSPPPLCSECDCSVSLSLSPSSLFRM
ncbi:UNVERIFIED_CONTAM: hypothetical protein FKN15_018652, partial [Acipenser sinensis]